GGADCQLGGAAAEDGFRPGADLFGLGRAAPQPDLHFIPIDTCPLSHRRYLPRAFCNCCPSELSPATADSRWVVAEAVCWAAWRMSFIPCVTWSRPICCWPVEAMICWKAWMLPRVLSAISRMTRSLVSACSLPPSARLTASSVSITELLIPFWMPVRMVCTWA